MKLTDRQRGKVFVMPSPFLLVAESMPARRGLAYDTLLQLVMSELIPLCVAVSFNAGNFASR